MFKLIPRHTFTVSPRHIFTPRARVQNCAIDRRGSGRGLLQTQSDRAARVDVCGPHNLESLYEQIRHRALVQYTAPYTTVDLSRMVGPQPALLLQPHPPARTRPREHVRFERSSQKKAVSKARDSLRFASSLWL